METCHERQFNRQARATNSENDAKQLRKDLQVLTDKIGAIEKGVQPSQSHRPELSSLRLAARNCEGNVSLRRQL
jgi:hypothetical protein